MKVFEVETPTGVVKVEAPENATDEQIIRFVQSQMQASKPEKPQISGAQQIANEQSFGENLLAGIGGGMMSLYLGGKQALGLADQNEIDEHKAMMAGLTTSAGGKIGDFTGQLALAAPAAFIPGANTYLGAAALGGAMGAAQPTSEGESRLTNTGVGIISGPAGKFVGDKAVKFLSGNPYAKLNAAEQLAARKGKELGFKMTPGQQSGSRGLQKLEASLEADPLTSRPFDRIKDHNQTVLNRIASKSIGENSDTLDYTILQNAQDRIGEVYESVATKTTTPVNGDKVLGDLSKIEMDFEGLLPKDLANELLVKKYIKIAEDGVASGKQLQSLSSKLGKVSNKQMTTPMGDRDLGLAFGQVKDSVDDLLSNTLDDQSKAAFNQARQQYRNLMLLTQRNTILNPSDGNVKANALAGLLQKKDRRGFMFGHNNSDLYNAARFGQAFRPIVGDSGTATRMSMDRGLGQRMMSPLTNTAASLYTSPPIQGIAGGGFGMLNQTVQDDLARLGLLSTITAANQLY